MPDKEKALVILRLASQTCSAALKALQDGNTILQSSGSISEASLETKLNDYASLLSLLHQNATKLAIALKPSSLAYSASITPAKELSNHADALASCAYSVNEAEHGRTLAREVRWSTESILSALESLLDVYTNDTHGHGYEVGNGSGEPYLVRTAVVHEAIDRARGISRTNLEAVKKRWDGILGGLYDCEKEVEEMVEEEEGKSGDSAKSGGGDVADIDLDDGWGELGDATRTTISASEDELLRLKSAQALFKFTHALIKRVDRSILRPSSRMVSLPPRTLDKLLSTADMFLKAGDDLVHALYIPQDSGTVTNKSKDLVALVGGLRSEMSSIGLVTYQQDGQGDSDAITDLSERTAFMSLVTQHSEESVMVKERRWFDTCFAQIFKSAARLA